MPISPTIHLVVSFCLALIMVPLAIRIGKRFDLLDHPGRHKRHKKPVPFLGGASLFATLWLTVLVLGWIRGESGLEPAETVPWIFAGSLVIFLVGLVDDLRPQPATVKLLAEAIAGLLLYAGGLKVDPISVPFMGQLALGPWSALVTIAWVIGLTNAINLIDGLDGLAAGISLIAAAVMAVLGIMYQVGTVLTIAATLIGFLAVFLGFNRHPARLFLGDSGSLQLGFYFAVISLAVPFKSYTAAALYLPLLALGVPILETAVSIVRRLAQGKSVIAADRRHLFHYLAMTGMSPGKVVMIFYCLSIVFGLSALAMFLWDRVLVSIILGAFVVVILAGFLILSTNRPRPRRSSPGRDR
jgi:UDP-GlcNAc:undecaprenyl-phosphate GlcNAc-1-phosphate transferase